MPKIPIFLTYINFFVCVHNRRNAKISGKKKALDLGAIT